jgi:hypothetical protein
MRCARLPELMHLLAELTCTAASSTTPMVASRDVDEWRRRIAQKVEDIQELIESSKFELGDFNLREIQQRTGNAQIIFILLLSSRARGAMSRHSLGFGQPWSNSIALSRRLYRL